MTATLPVVDFIHPEKADEKKVKITSAMAEAILENYQGANRRISEGRVLQYQSDMEGGRWHYDAMPIRFSVEGKLLDGQHRMSALANCIPAQEFEFLVVTGLDPDSQLYMDQGGARTAGQQLSLKGVKDPNVVASAVKSYLDWTRNRLFRSATRASTTKPEAVEWALLHNDLLDKVFATDFRRVDAPASVVGAFALATIQIAPARTHKFLNQLAHGTGYGEGDPILALDRRLRNIRRTRTKVSHREYLAYFIRAWNAWVSGNSLSKIQIGALSEDTFPGLLKTSDFDDSPAGVTE
jgi:hypothetical protein